MENNDINKQKRPTAWALKMAYEIFDFNKAISFLQGDFPIRRIDEELTRLICCKGEQQGIQYQSMEDILRKNLKNQKDLDRLLTPEKKSITRKKAFEIAFALGLTPDETAGFLKSCWLDGFYPRDAKDVIYWHGLKNQWSYCETLGMISDFSYLDSDNPNLVKNDGCKNKGTNTLSDEYERSVRTKEDLCEYLNDNESSFGTYRRKAYERFMELYSDIFQEENKRAADNYDPYESDRYTRVPDPNNPYKTLIAKDVVLGRIEKELKEIRTRGKKSVNKAFYRLITEHIPTRSALSEITKDPSKGGRRPQVSRKLLILTWLASEDGKMLTPLNGDFEGAFGSHVKKYLEKELLEYCGMSVLDARHPFDWIIMNTLRYAYMIDKGESTDIEGRLEAFFEILLQHLEEAEGEEIDG